MEKLHYTVRIEAPAHTVWTTMLDDDTYQEWASAFNEGSHYEGSWDLGSEIRFLGPDEDGAIGGMIGTVIENRPDELVTVEYFGDIMKGVERTGDEALFSGALESYSFSESDGVTTVEVAVDTEEEYVSMFDELWPVALATLKDLAEAR
ncbi:SRPBCC family protein [Cryobacterium cryoconiti]|uniref:SRPBCC domain-containing protein n=1 Tax=Cryobacterium cryoconiti TaxID=1259239 RepID=A0A4Y8JRA5_9MICO|nr:SRPBCC domain-containing protein [Cryobacterium cryoconiti]TFD27432.1 SRPBCC domain-containing protein [Cryobacterium cryoconiti]